jgi:two-component system phosphate regulon sensor histidine kinase PhoR
VVLNQKNASPVRLSFFTSLLIAVLTGIILLFFTQDWINILIACGSMAFISYFLIYTTLERFIYRKIKLIYKFISQTKATKREEFYNSELLPARTIDEVNVDVEKWAKAQKSEIEKLQSNEQFRKEFLMNLAHELRTPIFSTQGYIETLLDGAMFDENVRQAFLENSSKNIDRLAALVDDLDTISKLESNQVPIIKEEFIIQDLIKEIYQELAQKAEKKLIRLNIKKGCESAIEVFADKQKIKQVLVNLTENSIKYGKENGETTAGVYIIDGKNVFIEITDDGTGIAEDQIPRVFERFFRTDSARSRNVGGTGLGLAIVKHIIEAHGHTVSCRSKKDVGSSFGFTLDKSIK